MSDAPEWMPLRKAIEYVARVDGCSDEEAADRIVARLRGAEIDSYARFIRISSDGSDPYSDKNQDLPAHFWAEAQLVRQGDALSAVAVSNTELWTMYAMSWEDPNPRLKRQEASGILVRRDDLLVQWPEPAAGIPVPPERAVQEAGAARKGGRPPKFEWKDFYIEVIRIADLDGLPESQGEMERQMKHWCMLTWEDDIGDSTVEAEVRKIYRTLGRGSKT